MVCFLNGLIFLNEDSSARAPVSTKREHSANIIIILTMACTFTTKHSCTQFAQCDLFSASSVIAKAQRQTSRFKRPKTMVGSKRPESVGANGWGGSLPDEGGDVQAVLCWQKSGREYNTPLFALKSPL